MRIEHELVFAGKCQSVWIYGMNRRERQREREWKDWIRERARNLELYGMHPVDAALQAHKEADALKYPSGKTDGPRVCDDCHAVSGLPPRVASHGHTFLGVQLRIDLQSGWAARGEGFDSKYYCPTCAAKRGWVHG